jgi:5,10-methylenetetrahydromethanopterin reductase
MSLRLACLLAPGPKTVEHALLAEALGYDRVWLADSPALWQDIWARMALVAVQTHGASWAPRCSSPASGTW